MARGFSNALRIALGGVAGGLEGYGEKQERLGKASLLKQQQERQAEQDAINLAKSLVDMGFRPDFGEDDAIASSMPIPRQSTRLDTTLPTFGAGLAPAMERTRRESFGITPERPVAQPKPLVSALTQAEQVQSPRPRTGDKTLNVPGIGSMRMKRPETDEEKQAREMQRYEAQLGIQQRVRGMEAAQEQQTKTQQAERLADLYTKTYSLPDGRPLPRDMAVVAAMQGETPIDMGFVEKAMSNQERVRLSLDMQRLNLGEREYELKRREQDRRESDSQRRRESLPVSVQGKLAGYDSGVLMVNDVRSMINENPDAIGPVKGRLWSAVVDAADKSGVPVRAAIEGLTGEIRNQRFGGALTATEAKLAEEFLPTKKELAVNALSRLDQLQKFLENKRKGIFMTYKQPYAPIYTESPAPASAAGTTNPYR